MSKAPLVVYGALLVAAALAGCGEPRNSTYAPAPQSVTYPYNQYADRFVSEFRLTDGTRCVATNHGGIACDWKQQ
jgi:hypothetical protein